MLINLNTMTEYPMFDKSKSVSKLSIILVNIYKVQ